MIKLSLCMIVKNEANSLSKCLSSVQNVVEEMIILDTGSTDHTPEIARSFGAMVYHCKWCNDFAKVRNKCLKYAQGEWILILDADEVLVPEIIPQIRLAMQSDRHILINLVRHEIGAAQSPYSLVSRLFRHHPNIYFERPYHAMVDDSISKLLAQEPEWQIGTLTDVAILHYGYDPSVIAARDKITIAQTTMEGYLAKHPTDAYACSKLGALYVQIGEVAKGIKLLENGLNNPQSLEPSVLYELYYHLGIAYNRIQQIKKAQLSYQKAIEIDVIPQLKLGAYNNLGNLLLANGDFHGAKFAYQKTIEIDPQFVAGYYNLGMACKNLGMFTDAIACYEQAINLDPNYAEAYQNLGVVLLKIGNVSASLTAFKQAIARHEKKQSPSAQQLREGLRAMGFPDF